LSRQFALRGLNNECFMAETIEIAVPIEEIEAQHFETPDRVPVIPAIAHRSRVPKVGVRFRDYYAETMLHTQILAQKWLMENIRTDAHSITGAWVGADAVGRALGVFQHGNTIRFLVIEGRQHPFF
jgi:hypothetical protein